MYRNFYTTFMCPQGRQLKKRFDSIVNAKAKKRGIIIVSSIVLAAGAVTGLLASGAVSGMVNKQSEAYAAADPLPVTGVVTNASSGSGDGISIKKGLGNVYYAYRGSRDINFELSFSDNSGSEYEIELTEVSGWYSDKLEGLYTIKKDGVIAAENSVGVLSGAPGGASGEIDPSASLGAALNFTEAGGGNGLINGIAIHFGQNPDSIWNAYDTVHMTAQMDSAVINGTEYPKLASENCVMLYNERLGELRVFAMGEVAVGEQEGTRISVEGMAYNNNGSFSGALTVTTGKSDGFDALEEVYSNETVQMNIEHAGEYIQAVSEDGSRRFSIHLEQADSEF